MQIKPAQLMGQLLLFLTLGILLVGRWQLGQSRFFDVDEFSYLHWAAQVAHRQVPYRDFFLFVPPGFQLVFAPLFWLVPTVSVFLVARGIHFFIFLAMVVLVSVLFGRLRSWRYSLLPAVLLAFLPMPYDKFLEARPDNLATLLALVGLVSQVWGMRSRQPGWWLVSGMAYALSLVVLPKTVPFVMVGVGVALVAQIVKVGGPGSVVPPIGPRNARLSVFRLFLKSMAAGRWDPFHLATPFTIFFIGLFVPLVLLGLWLVSLGNFPLVAYSLVKLPFEANVLGRFFIMESHLFFFPNSIFYGGDGYTLGFIVNHAIWIVGLVVGWYRLFTPWTTGNGDRGRVLSELLVAGTFFLLVWGYVEFYPLKHTQYLVPIAVFVAFYAADGLQLLLAYVSRVFGWVIGMVVLAAILVVVVQANAQVNGPKRAWTNREQLAAVSRAAAIIPKDVTVFDTEGRLLFWQDAYYICCLPFGQFISYLSVQPEPLHVVLERKKVPYLYEGDSNRFAYLPPEDLSYIQSHYKPVAGVKGLFKRK